MSQMRKDDAVILHVGAQDASRGDLTMPSRSPFLIKMETFLRMNDIAYERADEEDNMNNDSVKNNNANSASSWVSFNGAKITDSEVAIEVLSKAHGVQEKLGFSAEQVRGTIESSSSPLLVFCRLFHAFLFHFSLIHAHRGVLKWAERHHDSAPYLNA